MRRISLAAEVFLAIFLSAFFTTVLTGVFAHEELHRIVRSVLGSLVEVVTTSDKIALLDAEKTIMASFDKSTDFMVLLAALVAGLAALVVAASLSRPVGQLVESVDAYTGGDHSLRMPVRGPAEIASLSTSFNRLADSLEEEDHLRRKLVADVSHEFRNPLTVAMAQTEAMIDGVLPADAAHLETLYVDLKHLEALVDDLREVAIAESGRWHYEIGRVDIAALLARNAKRAERRVQPGVELRTEGLDRPTIVCADELRIEQVVRNILGNAKRHTIAGSITLSLSTAAEKATVTISDTGSGIAPQDLSHIFERFYRGDTARSAETGGAGLGLSIVRSVVQDHGGEVFAESELGRGTVIGFTLPLCPDDSVPGQERVAELWQ